MEKKNLYEERRILFSYSGIFRKKNSEFFGHYVHVTGQPSFQGLSCYHPPGDGKMRDPGNKVGTRLYISLEDMNKNLLHCMIS